MIRDHTNRSGDFGPIDFDRLPTWWTITSGGVSERFPVRRSGFFDELRLFHVGLVDWKRFPPLAAERKWFSGAVPDVPNGQNRLGQPQTLQSPKNHVRHTGNRYGKPLPVCCRHGGFCLETTAVASSSRNTARKHVRIVGINSRDTVNMHICPFPINLI